MSAQNRERETLEISLPQDFVKKLEYDTGFSMADLDGVRVRIEGNPPRMVFTAAFGFESAELAFNEEFLGPEGQTEGPDVGSDAGTECNGKDNKWQDQSACGNLITKC